MEYRTADRAGDLAQATLALRRLGFSPHEVGRLVALRWRYERGDLREAPDVPRRWRFVRWLVERGRLSDGAPPAPSGRLAADRGGGDDRCCR
jgi:hypothetical protein